MQVRLTVTGDDATVATRWLEEWLAGHDELRGRVGPVVTVPQPGTMGSVAEVLMVAVGPGGVATAVASVLISWIRRQRGTVSVNARRPDGAEITLTADHVTQLEATLDGTGAGE